MPPLRLPCLSQRFNDAFVVLCPACLRRHQSPNARLEIHSVRCRGIGYNLCDLPIVEVYLARESARRGESDVAIPLMRAAVDQMVREGQLLGWGPPATGVLVETLLERGTENDRAEAEAAIERLAAAPADDGLVIRDIWLLRLRALLARARGDDAAYRDYRDRYRAMAESLGFEGHTAMAEALIDGGE